MSKPWVVLKFGGTSVAGRPQWETIARLLEERRREGRRVLLVCSAVAGVTDALERLADGGREASVDSVLRRQSDLAAELGIQADPILAEGRERMQAALANLAGDPHPANRAALMALGEWFSSRLGHAFLAAGTDIEWVDACEALEVLPEPDVDLRRAWLSARCEAGPDPALQLSWSERGDAFITQGYVARAPDGRTALLGRGGSDTSAALLAGRLEASCVEIWTDVPGLFSCDPRIDTAARLIPRLAYDEALEMAAGGARVIHGRSIRAAMAGGVPVEIRDLGQPDHPGTRIAAKRTEVAAGARAVCCVRRMAVLLLANLDTRQQVGFLAWVFKTIADRGVSVDLVATSETTTTVAINRMTNPLEDPDLDSLAEALSTRCRVEVFPDCSCVNLVGRGVRVALGRLEAAAEFFRERPLLMLSQSANDLGISLLVRAGDADELARLLHGHLVARG